MSNRGRLFLSGVISAGIHAYLVIAADPWIDPPRLEPSRGGPLQVITLRVARAGVPGPQAGNPSDPEPVAPVEDESGDSPIGEGIAPGDPPAHTTSASAATPREQASQAQPDKRVAKVVPRRNTGLRKSKAAAPKVRKSRKTPKRAAVKPASPKRTPKKSVKVRPGKRNSVHGKRLAGSKTRKPSASRSAKAGSRPKAASSRVRKPTSNYRPRPKYPRIARRGGLEGTVVLKVLVNTRGLVRGCRVHKSSGHRILDERAVKTVRKWTFEPGRKGAKPSAMWVKVPIRFQMK